jgi:hypothetical protein
MYFLATDKMSCEFYLHADGPNPIADKGGQLRLAEVQRKI